MRFKMIIVSFCALVASILCEDANEFEVNTILTTVSSNNVTISPASSLQHDKFTKRYLTSLDEKLSSLVRTVSNVDSNIRALQERAHVWEIFRHHINAWTDHMKSVDNKIDLLKTIAETEMNSGAKVENHLTQLDFKIQQLTDKIENLNRNMQTNSRTPHRGRGRKCEETMPSIAADITNQRLVAIERTLRQLQMNCYRGNRGNLIVPPLQTKDLFANTVAECPETLQQDDATKLKSSLDRMLVSVDKLSTRELRQVVNTNRRTLRTMEGIEDTLQDLEERTLRIYDNEAGHYKKLQSCCQSTNHEIMTFTSSADLLLKKIENVVLSLDELKPKKTSSTKNPTDDEATRETKPLIFYDDSDFGSGSGEF